MEKHVRKRICLEIFSVLLVFFMLMTSKSNAEEPDSEGVGFVYKNILPDNSLSKGNYFDLLMEPAGEQTLVTEIINQMDEDITINIVLNDAKTTATGLIEYGPSQLKSAKSMKIKMKEIVDIPESLIVKKGETKKLEMKIHLPKEKFDGILLGGIQLQREIKDTEIPKEKGQRAMIENEYAYVFSLSIREKKEQGKIDLGNYMNGVKKKSDSKQPYISFSNSSSSIVKKMTVETILTYQDAEEIISEKKIENMKMAPHSIIEIPFNESNLGEGKYRTKTKAIVGEESWSWEDTFSISKKEEKKKKVQIQSKKQDKNWKIVCTLAILFGGMVILIYNVLKKI